MLSFLLALLALSRFTPALAAEVLVEMDNVEVTVYYDLTNNLCGNDDPFVDNWAELSGINGGIPYCEEWAANNGKSLAQLGTNAIVAVNATLLKGDPETFCGKQLAIYDSDGAELQFSEGPLIIWDACVAAETSNIVDASASVFTQIKGGTCGGTNPTGLKVQILDTNIWEPILPGGSGGGPATGSVSSESATPTPTPTTTSPAWTPSASSSDVKSSSSASAIPSSVSESMPGSPTASPSNQIFIASQDSATSSPTTLEPSSPSTASASIATPSSSSATSEAQGGDGSVASVTSVTAPATPAATTSSSGNCSYGAWQCSGSEIQVCSYESIVLLDWITVGECPNKCSISSTGSVDCE